MHQTVFRRYELKYMLSASEAESIICAMAPYMKADKYGKTTVRNLYFDTDSYRIIRRSIEKPAYKEKLRIRSYGRADSASTVFVELKKKYEKVVYKRRLPLTEADAMRWVCEREACPVNTQISREIDYFIEFYGKPLPKVFLSYDREAYYGEADADFRVTFDRNILCRENDLSLCSEAYGIPILPPDRVLMELKCAGGIPLWMTQLLSAGKIYKESFSKYGTAYRELIFPRLYYKNSIKKETLVNGCNF